MEFKRANYAHNFLNAVETDHMAAWDMFVNELNELLVTNKPAVTQAIRDSGLRIHTNDSLKVMSDLIHDKIYTTPELRTNLNKLIFARHKDESISAEGGEKDVIYSNATGEIVAGTNAEDSAQVQAVNEATEKLVGAKPNTNELSLPKETVKELADENLKNKMEYAGTTEGVKKFLTPRHLKIGAAVLVGAIVIYGIYKIYKRS